MDERTKLAIERYEKDAPALKSIGIEITSFDPGYRCVWDDDKSTTFDVSYRMADLIRSLVERAGRE